MEKINIVFNNKNYSIDEASLSEVTASLKSHLSTVMNGTGATIKFDDLSYGIDSTKLSTARNTFVSHLGAISGSGCSIEVNGVKYNINSSKLSDAIVELENVLGGFSGDGDLGDLNEYGFYYDTKYSCYNSNYGEMSVRFKEDQTMECYTNNVLEMTIPATYSNETIEISSWGWKFKVISEGRELMETSRRVVYKLGDAVIVDGDYTYGFYCTIGSYDDIQRLGWTVYVNDTTKSNYGELRTDNLDGYPLYLNGTFSECYNLTIAPEIPPNVKNMSRAFRWCENLVTPPPTIPSSVETVSYAFQGCTSLTGTIEFNGNPLDCSVCFSGTVQPIVITGSCSDSIKAELAASAENGNVTY